MGIIYLHFGKQNYFKKLKEKKDRSLNKWYDIFENKEIIPLI